MENSESVVNLVRYDDPILQEEMPVFDFLNTDIDTGEFSTRLVKAMVEHGGVGLAANQIGERVRAFAIMTQPYMVLFNPFVLDFSEETVTLEESCLSYPGLVVKVTRPKTIKVRYSLPNNLTETKTFTGMTARIFQHELDHLNGKRFFDVVDWYEKEKVKKWFKKMKRNAK